MSEKKHTPGPWLVHADLPSVDPNWHLVTTANKLRVLANVHIEPGNIMDEANARLIAAAPDLFEACRLFVAYDEGDPNDDVDLMMSYAAALEAARAAISRALGESSQ